MGSAGPDDLEVRAAVGRERLSEPFAWDVEFAPSSDEPLALEELVGGEALLTMRRPEGAERRVHGIVSAIALTGVAAGRPFYRVAIAPALSRLAQVRRSRVFQRLSAPDIVAKVLDEGQVEHRLALDGAHPAREMCLQYGETDLAFVSRLLEEEGIFYYFEHSDGGHVMVLADGTGACPDVPGDVAIPYRLPTPSGAEEEVEHLDTLARRERLVPAKLTLRDFDFERPELDLTTQSEEGDGTEVYEYPGGFVDAGRGRDLAKARLEELRFGVETFAASGNCVRLAPGLAFEAAEHPDSAFARRLLVVGLATEATQAGPAGGAEGIEATYRSTVLAVDAGAKLRPRRRTRRPRAAAETAIVVGPSGEEIHPDAHGRVKVRFHWDREAKGDDTSSAWVRLAQAWAGAGFGASFVPRAGQEVLVRFLEGDPDRPLVVAAVYNGRHPPPVALPDDRTQSTLRTSSSPGGDGANEIHFEDAAGAEALSIHAQKDERIEVLNDKGQAVRGEELLEVVKDRSRKVLGNQRLAVSVDDASRVDGSQTLTVAGPRRTFVGASHSEHVGGQNAVTVGAGRTVSITTAALENVGLAAALTVGGAYAVTVGGLYNQAVGGVRAVQVGGARTEYVAGSRDESVDKNLVQRAGGDVTVEVDGRVEIVIEKDDKATVDGQAGLETPKPMGAFARAFDLKADAFKVIVAGKVALELKKSGAVKMSGQAITWDGSEIKTKGSAVKKVSGGSPPSGSATVRQLSSTQVEKASVDISLEDKGGEGFANEPFKVEFPDGTVKEGTLDGSGKARVAGTKPGNVKVSFPRLDQKTWKDK